MNKKLFWLPLLAALLSIIALYTIGNIFDISLLDWHFQNGNSSEEILFEARVSFIPIIIGFIIGFITERILKHKSNRNIN